jgi:hypothetical protein
MAISHFDLEGDISITDFRIVFGSAALSADKQKVVISYTGYAYPAKSDVDLDSYDYSLDNGVTWSQMTTASTVTSLTFAEAGTAHTLEWAAKEDEEMNFYNQTLHIRMTGTSGADETGMTSTSYYLERAVENLAQQATQSEFPDSYGGMSGSELLQQLAPKLV